MDDVEKEKPLKSIKFEKRDVISILIEIGPLFFFGDSREILCYFGYRSENLPGRVEQKTL